MIVSSSGTITGSLADGLIWIVSGETGPQSGSNGLVYIYSSASVGNWYPIAPLDAAVIDSTYLRLDGNNGPMVGTLNLDGNDISNVGLLEAATLVGTLDSADVSGPHGANSVISASRAVTASLAISASQATTSSYALTASYAAAGPSPFPFNGSALITGSLLVSGSGITIDGLYKGTADTVKQRLSLGTLSCSGTDLSGSSGNRRLPGGYDTYNIFFNENNGGTQKVTLWDAFNAQTFAAINPNWTGPITIAAQYNSTTTWIWAPQYTTINGYESQSIASMEWMTLAYNDQNGYNDWVIIARGRVGETLISSGDSTSTQSITGSLRVTGSLVVNGTSITSGGGSAFPFSGSALITGSLTVSGSGLRVTGSIYLASVNLDAPSVVAAPRVNATAIYPVGSTALLPLNYNPSTYGPTNVYNQSLFPMLSTYYAGSQGSTSGGYNITADRGHLGIGNYAYDFINGTKKLESIFLHTQQTVGPSAPFNNIATGVVRTIVSDSNTIEDTGNYDTIASNIYTANGRTHVLSVTGSMLARDGVSLGTAVSNQHYITGSVNVSGSLIMNGSMNVLSGSFSGSVVSNVTDLYTSTAAVTKIVSLTSAEYSGLGSKDSNTLYVVI